MLLGGHRMHWIVMCYHEGQKRPPTLDIGESCVRLVRMSLVTHTEVFRETMGVPGG